MPVSRRSGRQRPCSPRHSVTGPWSWEWKRSRNVPSSYTTGRWLLGTPLLEAAACLSSWNGTPALQRSALPCRMGTRGLAGLVAGERERALARVYLCTATARAGQMAGHYLQAQWPDMVPGTAPRTSRLLSGMCAPHRLDARRHCRPARRRPVDLAVVGRLGHDTLA